MPGILEKSAIATGTSMVWDKYVRTIHWSVAMAIVFNFFNDTGLIHRYAGYLAAALVLLRLFHGLWGSRSAASRFYFPSLKQISHHLADMRTGTVKPSPGHNPLGQLAAYLMWFLVLSLAVTGWVSRTDTFWGEDWPVDLHKLLSNILQVTVLLHLCGVVLMSRLQKENLIMAMITGRKPSAQHGREHG